MSFIKRILLFFYMVNLCTSVLAQNANQGREFLKRIEYNYRGGALKISPDGKKVPAQYNLNGKTDVERLLFGDVNAKIEFVVIPSFEGAYGFRLTRDSLDTSFILEIKRISNYEKVNKEMSTYRQGISIPIKLALSMPQEIIDLISEHNLSLTKLNYDKKIKLYEVDTRLYHVSDSLADKLYDRVLSSINAFRGEGVPAMFFDGEQVVFRCIVGVELWTLTIHQPTREMKNLADILNLLIEEIDTDSFDESKYINLLGD